MQVNNVPMHITFFLMTKFFSNNIFIFRNNEYSTRNVLLVIIVPIITINSIIIV